MFRDIGAQQSVCRNVTGESVNTGRYVLCRGMNSVEYYDYVHVELACSIVTAAAQVAVVDMLPVNGVDFLLGNNFADARVFPSSVPVVETPAGGVVASLYPVCAVTLFMANRDRAGEVSQDSGTDSRAHRSPQDEPAEMGAAVVGGGAEIGSLRANESLLAAGTRGDALVSSPLCQTGGANRRGVELPVVVFDVLVVVSEESTGGNVSVESLLIYIKGYWLRENKNMF